MNSGIFTVRTRQHEELQDITAEVSSLLTTKGFKEGLLVLYNPHTTAGLTINEGADPDVRRDLLMALSHIVPVNLEYRHAEGNSPSHLKAMLTGSSLNLLVDHGKLQLGTWQRVYFCEYDGPRTRTVHWRFIAPN